MNGAAVSVCKIECSSGFVVSRLMCPLSLLLNGWKAAADVVTVEVIGNVGVDDVLESVLG